MQKIVELLIIPFGVNLATSALFAWLAARWGHEDRREPATQSVLPTRGASIDTAERRLGVANRPMFFGESVLVTMTQGFMLWLAWWFPPAVISFRTSLSLDMARGVGAFFPPWTISDSVPARVLLVGLSSVFLVASRLVLMRPARWIARKAWPQNLAWQGRATKVIETYAIAGLSAVIATANVWAFTSLSVPNAIRVVLGGLVGAVLLIVSKARK